MKLGSLKSQKSLDGELVVVSRDSKKFAQASDIAPSLREALEKWNHSEALLKKRFDDLNSGLIPGTPMDESLFHSAMPRTFQWADGSAFIQHVKLLRKSRNAEIPETLFKVPLMYQGGGDNFLAPQEDILQMDFSHGTDFEGEVAVITDFVQMGSTPEQALEKIRLLVLVNDVSLRGLIPQELANGFGFFVSKPSSAFSPFALTPDELGANWKDGRVHLPLSVEYNGAFFGNANAREMHFNFGELVAHAAQTRHLMPGTIIGSGTVSNEDTAVGSSCLAEKRTLELLNDGKITTPFMKVGDTVKIEMLDSKGVNLFGTISQKVVSVSKLKN